ncbi:hypothetical protein L596_000861 [Steinernema carpocapsae]|uniref:Uncharacterized protein n=1 Tax=Steinernema carpocapsae TaxID=34508 RepID=A0A4U8ULP0_STECR|nr:hypothetical protein L596_000861 [Steinernema carpocapsae]
MKNNRGNTTGVDARTPGIVISFVRLFQMESTTTKVVNAEKALWRRKKKSDPSQSGQSIPPCRLQLSNRFIPS